MQLNVRMMHSSQTPLQHTTQQMYLKQVSRKPCQLSSTSDELLKTSSTRIRGLSVITLCTIMRVDGDDDLRQRNKLHVECWWWRMVTRRKKDLIKVTINSEILNIFLVFCLFSSSLPILGTLSSIDNSCVIFTDIRLISVWCAPSLLSWKHKENSRIKTNNKQIIKTNVLTVNYNFQLSTPSPSSVSL